MLFETYGERLSRIEIERHGYRNHIFPRFNRANTELTKILEEVPSLTERDEEGNLPLARHAQAVIQFKPRIKI